MTAARVPFLARLAPAARTGASSVRAALPSRFSPAQEADPPLELSEASGQASAAEPLSEPAAHVMPRAEHAAPGPVETTRPRTGSRPQASLVPAPPMPAQDLAPTSGQSESAAPAGPLAPPAHVDVELVRQLPQAPQAAPDAQVNFVPPAEIARAPASLATEPPVARHATRSRLTAAELHPPLRESTLARRPELPRAEPSPTVVHVSIDRIDLRFPAPPPPERRTAPARSRAATVPLADYLRQRKDKGS